MIDMKTRDNCSANILIFILLALSLGSQVCAESTGVSPSRDKAERIKIGVSLPLSGEIGAFGENVKNSLIYANEVFADNKYEFIFEDDRCDGKTAVTVAHKFVSIDKLKYVIGSCSDAFVSSSPVYQRAKVVHISPLASSASLLSLGRGVFHTWPNDSESVRFLYNQLASQYKRVGVLTDQCEWCQGVIDTLNESNTSKKIEISNQEMVAGNKDVRSYILKLKLHKVDAVLINTISEDTLLRILKELKSQKLDIPRYNIYIGASPNFLETAGALADDLLVIDLPSPEMSMTEDGLSHLKTIEERAGKLNYHFLFISSFEAFSALHQMIETANDYESSLDFLYSTQFNGLLGPWSFNQQGSIKSQASFVLKTIKNKKPELYSLHP